MTLVKVTCTFCKNSILKELRRYNEAKKFGWKFYCSLKCLGLNKSKSKILRCGNRLCNKIFKRRPKQIPPSGTCFCSRSCAAIINNPKSVKRRPKIRICPICQREFTGCRKYCSNFCIPKPKKITKKEIIKAIRNFYKNHNRIPLKIEFFHAKAARSRFGSWNEAVEAAGFDPNPVKFAKKHMAKDGHKCDSLAEKIIDDWLYEKRVVHERNVPYFKNGMTADFRIDGILIEFLGLKGELKEYDRLLVEKEKLWKEKELKVIKIYPKDLFPKNKLSQILKFS